MHSPHRASWWTPQRSPLRPPPRSGPRPPAAASGSCRHPSVAMRTWSPRARVDHRLRPRVGLRDRPPISERDRAFDPAVEALGPNITPHNLRDTAASLAIQADASVVAVARLLGHESAPTTLNHYAGLFPTDLDDVAERLNAAARQTIANQSASNDNKKSPTKHRPERSEEEVAVARKSALSCKDMECPRQDSNLRHRL
jgi:hypothetical protein